RTAKGAKGSWGVAVLRQGTLTLSQDGSLLAMAGNKNSVVVWDCRKKAERWRLRGHEGPVHTVALSADGKTLLSGGADQTLRLWDLGSGKEVRAFRGHRAAVLDAAFLPGGRLLSAAADGTLRVWDRASGKQLLRARWLIGPAPEAPLTATRFSADA